MWDNNVSTGNSSCGRLSLPLLRLMAPPLRLLSAAMWKTVQQKLVSHYGMLEELVSVVTELVPELLSSQQRVQLSLGLQARLILEMCQLGATDLQNLQPHLDRVQSLTDTWTAEVGGTDSDLPCSNFVDLVRGLLMSPEEKDHFFQSVFPKEFGPAFDEALHTLMWLFLSRLEKFVPIQTFQQVACALDETSSVLEECMQSVSQCKELRTLLQYYKNLTTLDHHDLDSNGSCIISALKLPPVRKPPQTQGQDHFLEDFQSCVSELGKESSALPQTAEITAGTTSGEKRADACSKRGEELCLEVIKLEKSAVNVQSEDGKASQPVLKECQVQLTRVDLPPSWCSRPVRPNRGLRMKMFLQEEKRPLEEERRNERPTRKTKQVSGTPIRDDGEETLRLSGNLNVGLVSPYSDGSWSFYSDRTSGDQSVSGGSSLADSWSFYSDDDSSFVSRVCSSTNPASPCSTEEQSDDEFVGRKKASKASKKPKLTDNKAPTPKKTRKFQCFMCKEMINTKLETHLKTHFPSGNYACPRCDARFPLYRGLQQHLKKACYDFHSQQIGQETAEKPDGVYKCEKCTHVFKYKVSLQRHTLTHHELYCGVCQRVQRDAETLERHKVSHTPFRCNRCSQSFNFFKHLLKHCANVHKVVKPFQCYRCPMTAVSLRRLIMHEWKHTGYMPFQCSQCSVKCRSYADLSDHVRVHTKEKPYLCSECGKTFSQNSNLLRHLNLIHSESRNEKKHSCPQCEKSFKEKSALKKHQRTKHMKELFRNPCPYCGKMLSTSTMARHKLIHTGEKPFKCVQCDKGFRSNPEVKRHVLMHHTAEKPYKCDVCGKGFIKMWCLKAHAKIHSGEKPFACNICGKAFLKASSMLRHKRLIHAYFTQ